MAVGEFVWQSTSLECKDSSKCTVFLTVVWALLLKQATEVCHNDQLLACSLGEDEALVDLPLVQRKRVVFPVVSPQGERQEDGLDQRR